MPIGTFRNKTRLINCNDVILSDAKNLAFSCCYEILHSVQDDNYNCRVNKLAILVSIIGGSTFILYKTGLISFFLNREKMTVSLNSLAPSLFSVFYVSRYCRSALLAIEIIIVFLAMAYIDKIERLLKRLHLPGSRNPAKK